MIVPSIRDIHNIENKVVIVRAGLNVPLSATGEIEDDFRLVRALPTLHYLVEEGARVVVISHIGREAEDTLLPVAEYLAKYITLEFKADFFNGDIDHAIDALRDELDSAPAGSVFLLDNVRQTEQEKANDNNLAERLGALADVYVNEAFSVSHREHMSMVGIPRYTAQSVAGIACGEEVEQLSLALNPPRQSVAIVSGNKFETKLPLITRFLSSYDTVVVGGALANTLYHLAGHTIGESLYEHDLSETEREDLQKLLQHPKLYLPSVVVVSQGAGEKIVKHISEVESGEYIYDIAPEGLSDLEQHIAESNLVVWNGPLGLYESGYTEGTEHVLRMVVASRAQSIIGGGNTVDAVRKLGYEDQVSFLSTGGGAMIEYLTRGTLPALEALHKK